jgi:hypothetical protein
MDELSSIKHVKRDTKVCLVITDYQIEAVRQNKIDVNGRFSDGVFIVTIESDDKDTWVVYYRNEPEKYKEI